VRANLREELVKAKTRWWRVVNTRRCFLMNLGSEMRDFQDLQTDWSCMRYLTGSLERISATISNGRVGMVDEEDEDDEVRDRVSVEEFNRCRLVAVVSSVSGSDKATSASSLGAISESGYAHNPK